MICWQRARDSGVALALLPSLVAFGLGSIPGKGGVLDGVSAAVLLGLLFNPIFAIGVAIGLIPTKKHRMMGLGMLVGFFIYLLLDCAMIVQLFSMAGLEM
jgi:hypothetical protein